MNERLAFLVIFVFYLFFYIFRRGEFTDIREKIKSGALGKMVLLSLLASSFLFIPLETSLERRKHL